MGQPLKAGEIPQPHYRKTQDRIDLTMAVDVLNEALHSDAPMPVQKVQVAMFYVGKMLPSMQAIAVQVDDKTTISVLDIMNQAAALGVDPADLFSTPETKQLITQEKTVSAQDQSEGGHPPDVDT